MVEAYSYEDLYELLRVEKASADLEKLGIKDLTKIASYFKAKEELLNQQETSTAFFSAKKRAKIQLEIDNALQILKNLFERREQKVINRAIFSIRSDSKLKDTTHMLEHEELFYTALLDLLFKNKKAFFELVEEQKSSALPERPKEFKSAAEIEKQAKLEDSELPSQKVKFLTEVPEFVDEQLKPRGPFKQGDVAELSSVIVDLLIKQEKAKVIG